MTGTTGSIDLVQVDDLPVVPDCYEAYMFIVNDDAFMPAHTLRNYKRNGVFEEVKDEGQNYISTRWVSTFKKTPDGIVPKARLNARGFEVINIPKILIYMCFVVSKIVLVVKCKKKWQLNYIHIKSAFLVKS